jgi:hypothetical protein
MMDELFEKWLKDNLNVSENTIEKYKRALNAVSKDMIEEGVIDKNIYSIVSSIEFEQVWERILDNTFFQKKDTRGNRMYSVAMKHYLDFLRSI